MTLNPDNTFFAADFHFDHANIIRYCNRPFASVEEMNAALLRNYNSVVHEDSLVFFLGDMSFGRGSRKPRWWLDQLRGTVMYIKGSHDHGVRPTNLSNCYHNYQLHTEFGDLYLVHEPMMAPANWSGWVVHGHTHSTQMTDPRYPRHVCVSMEAINYTPISLRALSNVLKIC